LYLIPYYEVDNQGYFKPGKTRILFLKKQSRPAALWLCRNPLLFILKKALLK